MHDSKVTKQKDCYFQKPSGSCDPPSTVNDRGQPSSDDVQLKILQELQRVNSRLDAVGDCVNKQKRKSKVFSKDLHKISKSCSGVNTKYDSAESSSQSSSDEDIPSLSFVRSSRKIQKRLDDRIAQIEKASESKGNDTPKIKPKRGIVEVLVSKKVSWPHDTILGGSTKQHVTCDQLTITMHAKVYSQHPR